MSSQTQTPQQLYEAERLRALALARKNVRLEAELQRLDGLRAESELRDQAKDAIIRDLQAALENAERSSTSPDVKKVEDLRAKMTLLHDQLKDAEEKVVLASQGKWKDIKPLLDDMMLEELHSHKILLNKSQDEVKKLQAELMEVRALNAALERELENTVLEDEDRASHLKASDERIAFTSDQALQLHLALEHHRSEVEGSDTKFLKNTARLRRRYNELVTKPKPVTKGHALQPSGTQTSVSQPIPSGKASRHAHAKVKAEPETTKATDDQGFTVTGKGRSTPARQGLKQESLAGQATSKNPYAALADHDKKTPKPLSQTKESTDSRQPFPNPKSVDENVGQRYQKSHSASQSSSGRGPSEAALDSQTSMIFGAPAPAKAPAAPRDQTSASKIALPVSTKTMTQPKPSFNPTATSFTSSPSKSMAQVAANPPKQHCSEGFNWLQKDADLSNAEKPIPKSKVSNRKRMNATAVGKAVEPATRKPKPEPTAADVAKYTLENDTSAGAEGPKSPMITADPQKRSASWEALERQLGKMPEKWSDTLENDEEQNMSSADSRPKEAVPPLSVKSVTLNFGVQDLPPDHGAQSAEKASENFGPSTTPGEGVPLVQRNSPAPAKSDPHQSAAQVTTVTGNQSEGVRLIDPVFSGTLPSSPAATGPSPPPGNVIPGMKKIEDEARHQPHPSGSRRPKGKKGKKFHTQSELLDQAKAGTDKS